MTIRISKYDSFKLNAMTQAILENRPSFTYIQAEVDGAPADIYTRLDSQTRQNHQLIIQSRQATISLNATQKNELEHLVTHTERN